MATTFAVPDGRVAMAATLWNGATTGTNLSVNNTVNTVSFQPDLVWSKARNNAYNHYLQDSVRGITNGLSSNLTAAEATTAGSPTSFTSTGFNISSTDVWSSLGNTEVSWQWKAGGTAVSNTAGSITSSVSANTTAGFSVVTYTGNGTTGATVGHGLGVTPGFIIFKSRDAAQEWRVWLTSFGTGNALTLNSNTGTGSNSPVMNAAPSSTVFTLLGTGYNVNSSGVAYVAYCWAPVAGYSAFGSYTGNGSADGPFIYTGFRPRFLMIKSSSGAFNWFIEDSSRNTTNVTGLDLSPNLSDAEANNSPTFDFLSNGFKLRNTYTSQNGSGSTYIYAAFAENPLKFSNAR
jgi:hypothetical protein